MTDRTMRGLAVTLPTRPGLDVQALDKPLAELHLEIAGLRERLLVARARAPQR